MLTVEEAVLVYQQLDTIGDGQQRKTRGDHQFRRVIDDVQDFRSKSSTGAACALHDL